MAGGAGRLLRALAGWRRGGRVRGPHALPHVLAARCRGPPVRRVGGRGLSPRRLAGPEKRGSAKQDYYYYYYYYYYY